MGRPTQYDVAMCALIENTPAEALGAATITDICILLGVPYKMVYDWMNEHDDFRETVMRARDRGDQLVINALRKRAEGFEHPTKEQTTHTKRNAEGGDEVVSESFKIGKVYVPPDTNAAKFWLANRQRKEWADRKQIDLKADFLELVDKFAPKDDE